MAKQANPLGRPTHLHMSSPIFQIKLPFNHVKKNLLGAYNSGSSHFEQ